MIFIFSYVVFVVCVLLVLYCFECCELCDIDVVIEIFYCGVCYFDLYIVCDEWGIGEYLIVFGYEIVGCVLCIGKVVIKFKEGDFVGVGCMVDFCCECVNCWDDLEQFCFKGVIFIYVGKDCVDGMLIQGGYFIYIVVDEVFVLCVFDKFDFVVVVLLLCVGIIMYLLFKYWKVGKGFKVGVIGLGGLGYMVLKFVYVFGVQVVQFIILFFKCEDVLWLGVDEVVLFNDVEQMKQYVGSFDFIFDMVLVLYDFNEYLCMFKCDGMMVLVGLFDMLFIVYGGLFIFGCYLLVGLLIGGIVEMQEMFDFCVEYGIVLDIEQICMQDINEVYECMFKSDVKYCFVIDMVLLCYVV